MKRYIEKYFLLLIFIFALSLVNVTYIFALDEKDILSGTKGAGAAGAAQITLPTEEEINKAIPVDLSTKEAFDKIKEVFTVKVERLASWEWKHGLVHVRVTIAPKAVASDVTKPTLLEKLKKVFNQRIIALAENAPTNLGATLHTAPAPGSLYELIYKGAVDGLILNNIEHISTNLLGIANPSITYEPSNDGDIVNAKVIAVRKGLDTSTVNILLQLDGDPNYVSGFEKLSGVKVSYAHIVDPAATGAAFVAPENFKEGLVDGTRASTSCNSNPTTRRRHISDKSTVSSVAFVNILTDNPGCRNLLKITVPTATTAEFGIPDSAVLDPKGTPADHVEAARTAADRTEYTIRFIFDTFYFIKVLTGYFNPNLGETDDHYLYASAAIRNQLKNSRDIKDFNGSIIYSWPASEYVQAILATLPIAGADANGFVSLLRVSGDPRSVYLTKEIRERSK